MHIMQSRRDFLATLSAAGAASVLGGQEIACRRRAAGDDHDPACPRSRHLRRALVHRRGPAARGRLHRHPATCKRGRRRTAQMIARGEIDFASISRHRGCSPRCGRADHSARGCACRLLRAVRARPDSHRQRLEGQEGRRQCPGLGPGTGYIAIMAAYVGLDPHEDIEWVEGLHADPRRLFPLELFRGESRCLSRVPAGAAGAARPQDRPA